MTTFSVFYRMSTIQENGDDENSIRIGQSTERNQQVRRFYGRSEEPASEPRTIEVRRNFGVNGNEERTYEMLIRVVPPEFPVPLGIGDSFFSLSKRKGEQSWQRN